MILAILCVEGCRVSFSSFFIYSSLLEIVCVYPLCVA